MNIFLSAILHWCGPWVLIQCCGPSGSSSSFCSAHPSSVYKQLPLSWFLVVRMSGGILGLTHLDPIIASQV